MTLIEAEQELLQAARDYARDKSRTHLGDLKIAAVDYAECVQTECGLAPTDGTTETISELITHNATLQDDILAEVADFQRKLQQDLAVARAKDQENQTTLPEV